VAVRRCIHPVLAQELSFQCGRSIALRDANLLHVASIADRTVARDEMLPA